METERKYLNADFSRIRGRLVSLPAQTEGPHFETNIVLDKPDHSLRAAKSLLRLRRQQWPGRERHILTFKCVSKESAQFRNVKAREEFETEIALGQAMLAILGGLGYAPVARYEKMRQSWRLNLPEGKCDIDLDTLPFGEIVEIEAPPGIIDHVAALLGVDKCEISLKNYYELNQEWREARNLPPASDILFDQQEKNRLMELLGLPGQACPPPPCSSPYL